MMSAMSINATIALEQYKIDNQINEGSFGTIFGGIDIKSGENIVLKVCYEKDMNKIETNVLRVLNKKGLKNFPKLYDTGVYN